MNTDEAFGAVLRELRVAKGITQEKLSFEAELDRTFISLLERGLRQPSLATIFQISKALGVSPSRIIQRVEDTLHEAGQHSASTQAGRIRPVGGGEKN